MKNFKKATALSLVAFLSLGAIGCGKKEATYVPIDEEDTTVYSISICKENESDYYNMLEAGFTDALYDLFGEDHLALKTYITDEENGSDAIVSSALSDNTQLIYTVGPALLQSASIATETTPIVATGVIDFQDTLHILKEGNSKWNKKTERNITGIDATPPISDQLSLLIEATPDLQAVGIIYSTNDSAAIYQNEILEKYLDQAGIPWKEYQIPSTDEANTELLTEGDASGSAIEPSKEVMPSAKEGTNIDNTFDDGIITGLNLEKTVRLPKLSNNWSGGKVVYDADTASDSEDENSEENSEDDKKDEPTNATTTSSLDKPGELTPIEGDENSDDSLAGTINFEDEDKTPEYVLDLPDDASTEDIISYACNECSALYISADSMLADQMEPIGSIATDANVTTLGGDPTIGQNTLVTLYCDAYDMGYKAGKMAYKILVKETDPGTIKIGSTSSSATKKLYNEKIAKKYEMTFPKSFTELNEYLESYELGSFTSRISSSSSDSEEE